MQNVQPVLFRFVNVLHPRPIIWLLDDTPYLVVADNRYLGIFIVRSRAFKCSLDHAKKSFYRSANAIFARIGRVASEEVTAVPKK